MKKQKQTGIEKQDAFINEFYSQPIFCPACKGQHSYFESKNSNGNFCHATGKKLHHGLTLIGGEQIFNLVLE